MQLPKKLISTSNNIIAEYLVMFFAVLILLLTAININNSLQPQKIKVLGIQTSVKKDVFWEDFLAENPYYLPGWVESGRWDKAKKIDPNYEISIFIDN